MPQKISVDEIMSKRKDLQSGTASIVKAIKTPSSWDKQNRTASFVMNAQAKDRYGDIVMTAGIDTADFEKNPVALLFHNSRTWPIGTWSDLQKVTSGRPPRLEGKLNLLPEGGPVKEVDECAWMIANGGVRGCSIGFMPDWDNYELILDEEGTWDGGIRFLASTLLEASVCSLPASPQSLIKNAPSMSMAREFIEDILDNYTKTPEGLILPRSEYEAAHKEISGNPTSVVVDVNVDEYGAVKAVVKDDDAPTIKATDETEGLPEETKQTLIQRGMVFCTELKSEEKTLGGYVIAKSHEDAEAIVSEIGSGEKVLGALVNEEKTVPEDKVKLSLDIESNLPEMQKHLEDIEATADRVGEKVEGIFARLSKFFGGKSFADEVPEKKEPELTIEPEVKSPPTEDEISAAKARAAEIRAKLISKELIAAE